MGKVTFVGKLDVDKLTQAMSELLTEQYGAPLGARITVTAKPREYPEDAAESVQDNANVYQTV